MLIGWFRRVVIHTAARSLEVFPSVIEVDQKGLLTTKMKHYEVR